MNWFMVFLAAGVLAAFVFLKRLGLISPQAACVSLKQGARIIDVRGEGEFQEAHLPGAINIPLSRLGDEIGRHIPDKEQVILLHCLSGGRSGIGSSMLKRMGYRNCFNLGSFDRAQKIAAAARSNPV